MAKDIEQGEILYAEGKMEEAEAYFHKTLRAEPRNAEALNNLGVIAYARGDIQKAEGYFLEALANEASHLDSIMNLANIYEGTRQWAQVVELSEKFLRENDHNSDVLNLLANACIELGHKEKAKEVLIRSLCVNPSQKAVKETLRKLQSAPRVPLPSPGSESFRAAFTEINITPVVSQKTPVLLQGMAGSPRKAVRASTPLMIQLLLLEDGHFTKVLFVSADIFGFGPEIVEPVKEAAAQWGIQPEGIVLNASHTHYAPGTISHVADELGPYYEDYAHQISKTITGHLTALVEGLEKCDLWLGRSDAKIGVNRRRCQDGKVRFGPNEQGYYETITPFLVCRFKHNGFKIIVVNHGCHPTGLGSENAVSSDYPGYLRQSLIDNKAADAVMFLQGAAGSSKESIRKQTEPVFCETSTDAQQNGDFLAVSIMEVLANELLLVEGPIFCVQKRFSLPLREPPSREVLKSLATATKSSPATRQWATNLMALYPSGKYPQELSLDIQFIALGEAAFFMTLPGEPVAQLGQKLRQIGEDPDRTFLLGYTNGLLGYLVTDQMIDEGGYEVETSPVYYLLPSAFDKGSETEILAAAQTCVQTYKEKGSATAYGRHHLTKLPKRAFFVLSTGRCGTKTLAQLLDSAPNGRVWHHPKPYLINETLQAYHNRIDKVTEFWKARSSIINRTWAEGLIHGETDHNMTPFCDIIKEEIPASKFVVLVRDPRDFVQSGMRRNYYHGHPWDSGRLRPPAGIAEWDRWHAMDQFEKICWLWRETYEYILKAAQKIAPERVFILRFEDLIADFVKTAELFDFLGLTDFHQTGYEKTISKKLNAQQTGDFPTPENWTEDLHETLWKECGELAMTFGYRKNAHPKVEPVDTYSRKTAIRRQPTGNVSQANLLFLELPGTSTGGHLNHIIRDLQKKHHVRYVKTNDETEIEHLIDWAEIVWLEWANQMAIHVTNQVPHLNRKRVVCRLHGYEVFTDLPTHINWNVVDQLIFVAEHKQEIFNEKFAVDSPPQTLIRNGVDTERFSCSQDKQNTKNLVLLGHINFRKGLPLLLQFFHQLLKRDADYRLFIRGEFQEPRLEMAARTMIHELSLEDKIRFIDWVDDLNKWFFDKSHILSFSLEESFHYAIGNGMAAGLKPVVHAWNESRKIWPEKFVFNDLDSFLSLLLDGSFEPAFYRKILFDRKLDAKSQMEKIDALIEKLLEKEPKFASTDVFSTRVSKNIPERPLSVTPSIKRGRGRKKHVFIIGLKRSGTTIFWKTFRGDNRFVCFDEPFRPHLRAYVENGINDKKGTMDEYLTRPRLTKNHWSCIQPYEEQIAKFLGHQVLYLKEMLNTSENVCIDFVRCHSKMTHLRKIAPDALIIHLVRDPRAFVTSHLKPYQKWLSPKLPEDFFAYDGWFDFWQYQTLANILGFKGFAHEQLMQIWNHFTRLVEMQQPDLTIQFENFATKPDSTIQQVYEFLEMEYHQLDFLPVHPPNPPYGLEDSRWEDVMEEYRVDRRYLYFQNQQETDGKSRAIAKRR
jgi:glycosyltransferase involved in cell wall biosynthesis